MLKKAAILILIISMFILSGCASATPEENDTPYTPEEVEVPPATDLISTPQDDPDTTEPQTDEAETGNDSQDVFFFVINGVEVRMGEPALPIIEKLGQYNDFFEAPSCAFEGFDRSWYYSGFVVHAYPDGDEDFILSVVLNDDANGTDRRVFIGMSYEDMVAAYGSDYEQNQDQFLYRLGSTSLAFIISDDFIASITYRYEDAPELEL